MVKGFKEKKAKDVLMVEVENIVKTIMGNAHNIIINVPDDPCNHGILTFEDNAKKLDFYKKVEEKWDELDDNISFTNKVSWSDRVVEKKLGFIKFLGAGRIDLLALVRVAEFVHEWPQHGV